MKFQERISGPRSSVGVLYQLFIYRFFFISTYSVPVPFFQVAPSPHGL